MKLISPIPTFPSSQVFNQYFIIYTYFDHIADSNTVIDNITNSSRM